MLVPLSGDLFRPRQLDPTFGPRLALQVQIYFNWARWLQEHVLAGRNVVLVNMDETSISFAEARRAGHVANLPRGRAEAAVYERIGRRETHGHMTLVAFLARDPELRPLLPQVLLTKDASSHVVGLPQFRRSC